MVISDLLPAAVHSLDQELQAVIISVQGVQVNIPDKSNSGLTTMMKMSPLFT